SLAEALRIQFEVDQAISHAGPPGLDSGAPDLSPTRDGGAAGSPLVGVPAVPGYEVLEELGHGGQGVVYKARHLALDRLVALKMIRTGALADGEERGRFQAEAQAVARLAHPNITQIYEVGEAGGLAFLALEYVAGGSLADVLRGRPLPPRSAVGLAATLAQ